jgi:hypothetical protein
MRHDDFETHKSIVQDQVDLVADVEKTTNLLQDILKDAKTLVNSKKSLVENTSSIQVLIENIKILQEKSIDINNRQIKVDKNFQHENSELIQNLNSKIGNLYSKIGDEITEKLTKHSDSVGIDLKKDIEISKQHLSSVMIELTALSEIVQKDISNIKNIVPKIDTKEIERTMKNSIKKSFNYDKVIDVFDEYAGKVSYFAEKTREYESSMILFDNVSKRLNKYLIFLAYISGIFSGISIAIALKWYLN